MKRHRSSLEGEILTARPRDATDIAAEYAGLTAGMYDFSICVDSEGNKWVRSDQDIMQGKEILEESPLICWPNGCSARSWNTVLFCEHCLRVLLPDSSVIIASVSADSDTPSMTTASAKTFLEELEISEEPATTTVPRRGTFCSDKCYMQAVQGGVTGPAIGWFTIIGGSEELERLRQSDWKIVQRGDDEAIRSTTPIPAESIARYLASFTWRYCILRDRKLSECHGLIFDENIENQIFIEASRTFERLVSLDLPSGMY